MATEEIDAVLHDAQNWAARSHQELYAAVHNNNDPGQAGEIGSEWGQFGSELTEAAQVIADRVTATETGWTGEAADNARTAIKLLSDWITETAQTAVDVGNRVADQSRVMATARATMPEPVRFHWDAATQMLSAPGLGAFVASAADVQAANEQARSAHEAAVAVMNTMEQNSRTIDRSTPVFTPPFNPVTGETEEPVVATARMGAMSLSGASMPATRPDGFAADASAPSGAAAVDAGSPARPGQTGGTVAAAAFQPTAPAMPTFSGGAVPSPTGWDGTTAASSGYGGTGYGTGAGSGYGTGGSTGTSGAGGTGYGTGYGTGSSGRNTSTSGSDAGRTPASYGTGVGTGAGTNWLNSGAESGNSATGSGSSAAGAGGSGSGGSGGAGGGAGARGAFGAGALGSGALGSGALGAGAAGAGALGGQAGQVQPGGSTGTLQPGQQAQARGGVPMTGGPGAATAAGAAMGAPMAGAGNRSEDRERKSASYIMSGDLFEVPGENLPPSVIGGAKKKKAQDT